MPVNVALIAASDEDAVGHFEDTVARPVNIARPDYEGLLSPELSTALRESHGGDLVPLWGTKRAKNGAGERHWRKLQSGDVAVFTGSGKVTAVATVAVPFENAELASRLWHADPGEPQWQFMYSLRDVRVFDDDYGFINEAAGYSPRNIIQGFTVLEDGDPHRGDIASRVLLALEENLGIVRSSSHDRSAEEVAGLRLSALEVERIVQARAEQGQLRKYLLSGADAVCDLCVRTFPSELLVAAHIKPRSECSDDEKRDFENVAMVACRFGCDELFERGFVSVDAGGTAVLSDDLPSGPARGYALAKIEGNSIARWQERPGTRPHFAWHIKNRFRG
ncbi:hypothetical protein [Demequina salsinemoris]|uniref:hypothetical protein n=1 Tax=Demequina salsinemoris TaxID=577470 RepID=UPI000A468470|nr:hypothetical protein [Demequina salsinemoris]